MESQTASSTQGIVSSEHSDPTEKTKQIVSGLNSEIPSRFSPICLQTLSSQMAPPAQNRSLPSQSALAVTYVAESLWICDMSSLDIIYESLVNLFHYLGGCKCLHRHHRLSRQHKCCLHCRQNQLKMTWSMRYKAIFGIILIPISCPWICICSGNADEKDWVP